MIVLNYPKISTSKVSKICLRWISRSGNILSWSQQPRKTKQLFLKITNLLEMIKLLRVKMKISEKIGISVDSTDEKQKYLSIKLLLIKLWNLNKFFYL